jgi:hypothetical protein
MRILEYTNNPEQPVRFAFGLMATMVFLLVVIPSMILTLIVSGPDLVRLTIVFSICTLTGVLAVFGVRRMYKDQGEAIDPPH